jgi:DNA-binding response OmpR family regulator
MRYPDVNICHPERSGVQIPKVAIVIDNEDATCQIRLRTRHTEHRHERHFRTDQRKKAASIDMEKSKKPGTALPVSRSRAPRAILIEADPDYAAAIEACLATAGCESELVSSVKRGLGRLHQAAYDLVVWGVAREDEGRSESVEHLRAAAKCPIIVVDESTTEARASFESGADQFLAKPFVPGALVGAVKSALRTQGPSSAIAVASRIEIGGAIFDADQRRITSAAGDEVTLTGREWDLFTFLLGHSNRYFTAADLIREAWGAVGIAQEQLRTYVSRLRQKTMHLGLPCQLESRQGLGYRLVLDDHPGESRESTSS